MYEISRGKVSVIFLGGMVFWTFLNIWHIGFCFIYTVKGDSGSV